MTSEATNERTDGLVETSEPVLCTTIIIALAEKTGEATGLKGKTTN